MIDLHTHILPGVDDGPSDMEESLKIIERGIRCGVDTFVLTPHIKENSDWEKIDRIEKTFFLLKRECSRRRFDVKLVSGAELFLVPSLPAKIKDNVSVMINIDGTRRYALIELPFYQLPVYTEDILLKLMTERVTPIIAHPERYIYVIENWEILKKWANNGIMIQANIGSLSGQYGIRVKRFTKKILKNGLVHFWGSDVHSVADDYLSFSKVMEIVSKAARKTKSGPISRRETRTGYIPF